MPQSSRGPKLSVIVVAVDRIKMTLSCLQSISESADRASTPIEVLLFLNAVTDEFKARLADFKASNNLLIRIESTPVRLKPGAARNRVIPLCQADWIFFLDDDAYIETDLLSEFFKLAANNPNAVLFGLPNITPPASSKFQLLAGLVLGSFWGTLIARSRYEQSGRFRRARETDLTSCGLFINRRLAPQALFPPFHHAAEESHMLLGILRDFPTQCFYVPELKVFHERRTRLKEFMQQIFKYAWGRGQLCRSGRSEFGFFWIPPLTLVALPILLFIPKILAPLTAIYWFLTLLFTLGILGRTKSIYPVASLLLFPLVHTLYAVGFLVGFAIRPGESESAAGGITMEDVHRPERTRRSDRRRPESQPI